MCLRPPTTFRGALTILSAQSLERGRRSSRAVTLVVAEMYINGNLTRDAKAVMKEFGIESLASTQVRRVTKLLDDELPAWRN